MANELEILIRARDEFSKEVDSLGASLKSHSKDLKLVGASMLAVGGTITATLGLSLKQFADTGEELSKMAQRTGLSVEALSELKYAAEASGTDINALEAATRNMGRVFGDAAQGSKAATDSLSRYNLSVGMLQEFTPEETFLQVAAAVAQIPDPTMRSAAAMEMFGKSGTQLLPMLSQGAKGLDALRQEAHDLGITFTDDAAKSAVELGDAMKRLEASGKGIQNVLGMILAPVVTDLADKAKGVLMQVQQWTKANPELTRQITLWGGAIGLALIPLGTALMLLPQLASGLIIAKNAVLVIRLATIEWTVIALAAVAAVYGVINVVRSLKGEAYVGKGIGDTVFGQIKQDLGALMGKLNELMPTSGATIQEFTRQSEANFGQMATGVSGATQQMKDFEAEAQKIRDEERQLAMTFTDLWGRLTYGQTEAGKLNLTMEDVYQALYKLGVGQAEVAYMFEAFQFRTDAVNLVLQRYGLTATQAAVLSGKLKDEIASSNSILDQNKAKVDGVTRSWNEYADAVKKAQRGIGGVTDLFITPWGVIVGKGERALGPGEVGKRAEYIGGIGLTGKYYAQGGVITETGLSYMHRGEFVIPANKAGALSIGNLIIYAGTREGGQAAAGGFVDELQRRGIKLSGVFA